MGNGFTFTTDCEALLAAIHADVDDMTLRLAFLDWAEENEELIRQAIVFAQTAQPLLTDHGLGIIFDHTITRENRTARFEDAKLRLPQLTGEVALSMAWLAGQNRRSTVDRRCDSYTYKHQVERYFEGVKEIPSAYVSNGAFIAAGIAMGVTYKESQTDYGISLNVLFGLSRHERVTSKTPTKARRRGGRHGYRVFL